MSEWKETDIGSIPVDAEIKELRDCIELIIDHRGKTPKKLGGDWVEKGIPAISAKNVHNGELTDQSSIGYVTPEIYKKWMKEDVKEGDCFLVSEGATLGEYLYWDFDFPIVLSQRLFCIRTNPEILYSKYFYAYMASTNFQSQVFSRATGSSVEGLRQTEVLSLKIPVLPMKKQIFIGNLLYNLEKKQKALRRQNETLEAIAQTLFKHWFVDFEFPNEDGKPYRSSGGAMVRSELGEIPAGWRVAPFETTFLIPLRNGLTKPRSVRGSGFYMVNMGELFGNKRIGDLEMDRVELSDSEYEKSLLEVGDILFARQSLVREGAGQCSIITEAPEPRTFEGHLIRCRIDRKKANPFYFFYHFWSFAGGFQMRSLVEQVAAAGIRGSELAKLEMLIPPVDRQDKFFTVIEPLEKSIALNFRRIRTLTKIRDVLLPKLMSGKLRITE